MFEKVYDQSLRAVASRIVDYPASLSAFAREHDIPYYQVLSTANYLNGEYKGISLYSFLLLTVATDTVLMPSAKTAETTLAAFPDLDPNDLQSVTQTEYALAGARIHNLDTPVLIHTYTHQLRVDVLQEIAISHPFKTPSRSKGNRRDFARTHKLSDSYLRQILGKTAYRDIEKIQLDTFHRIAIAAGWTPKVVPLPKK